MNCHALLDQRQTDQLPQSQRRRGAAQLTTQRELMLITQNGEARAVLQDVASYEETQETLALLKILALGNQDIAAGKLKPLGKVVTRLRVKRTMA